MIETLRTITGRVHNYLSKKDGIIIAISDIIDAFHNTTRWNEKEGVKEE